MSGSFTAGGSTKSSIRLREACMPEADLLLLGSAGRNVVLHAGQRTVALAGIPFLIDPVPRRMSGR